MRVVYLTNFLSPDIVEICREFSRRVGELIVLVSVPMEGNRNWKPTDADLDVRVQKTWTITRTDRHPSGYEDVNYVHVPLDTYGQLRRLRPDVIVSAEMGARSMFAAAYRRMNPSCRHIIAVNTSAHIEASRDRRLRRWQRQRLLCRADAITHNGPSCREYLIGLGVNEEKLSEWMYAADPSKIYNGPVTDVSGDEDVRLLTVGQLIDRKGVLEALNQLIPAASQHPSNTIHWTVVGDGPLGDAMIRTEIPVNLKIDYRGNCDGDQIRDAYRDHEIMLFPTLGDEWGLVVDEALHSGLAVIGSRHAQSVPTLIKEGTNGWSYTPENDAELPHHIANWLEMDQASRMAMRVLARESAVQRTPAIAAQQICDVISKVTTLR